MKPTLKTSRAFALVLLLAGCDSGNNNPDIPDLCSSKTLTLEATVNDANTGEADGSIVASAAGSTGFMYKLEDGAYQSSGTFENLAKGDYTITAKDKDDCLISQTFTVGELPAETISFNDAILPIFENVCWNCHKEEGQSGFSARDLSTPEKIQASAQRISEVVASGYMPKAPYTLTEMQKSDIAEWYAAGAPINN